MRRKRNKVYVVGTGRCGTASLAEKLGGLHEPEPNIVHEATQYYFGNLDIYPTLVNKLKERKKLSTSVIADNKQSLVIPLIREIDPKAKFVLLVREPMSCIKSFYARGAYSEDEHKKRKAIWVDNRLIPHMGFPEDWSQFTKCAWYWVEIHRTVFSSVDLKQLEIILTDEIGKSTTLNQSKKEYTTFLKKKEEIGISREEQNFFDTNVTPMWKQIYEYRNK